jgi:hypothetical protein
VPLIDSLPFHHHERIECPLLGQPALLVTDEGAVPHDPEATVPDDGVAQHRAHTGPGDRLPVPIAFLGQQLERVFPLCAPFEPVGADQTDAQKVAQAIHVIQNKLMSRPTYRRYRELDRSP